MSETQQPPMPMPPAGPQAPPGGPPGMQGGGKPAMPPMPNMLEPDGFDPFSAPIPGQSLARPPGTYPFEKPPQFTDPEDAFQAILRSVTRGRAAEQLLNLLEIGIPVKAIVMSLLQGGFMEGKWSVDVALLISQPVTALIMRMAREAGIRPNLGIPPRDSATLDQVVAKRLKSLKDAPPEPEGLMVPKKRR